MDDLEDALKLVYGRIIILGLWAMAQRRDTMWSFEVTTSD